MLNLNDLCCGSETIYSRSGYNFSEFWILIHVIIYLHIWKIKKYRYGT